ncbi:LUC7-domain-containing protein [Metschnikowia bicuspidata]|uniref:LUC7-domain-containing protein n=1 Tax=Metschnikowia bicuspidata TaxID=27322 RepID=A0A4P9ZAA9_9ASCO|nr:LUC7-domain-containing protein [Metschnikowia bicuspidata]
MPDEQRRLLEQLMGREALISPQVKRKEMDFFSPSVCKAFLVGSCPFDLFADTKLNLGSCPNLHLEKHKLEYEFRTKKRGETFPNFEFEYYKMLEKYIGDIDATIATTLRRLEHTPDENAKIATVTKDLELFDTSIGLMLLEIRYLAQTSDVLKALEQLAALEKLLKERERTAEQAHALAENVGQSSQQKLQVCEVCGAYLSRLDSDRRLADHFIGKIHLGYAQMRAAHAEYKKMYT